MAGDFSFSPLDPAIRRDPFALYARGRREHPVFLHEGLPLRVVSVFRYADVQAILRDDVGFSNSFPLPAPARRARRATTCRRRACSAPTARSTRGCAAS